MSEPVIAGEASAPPVGVEVVTEAGDPRAAEDPNWAKALELLGDDVTPGDPQEAEPAPEEPAAAPAAAKAEETPPPADAAAEAERLFKQKFDQYRREYGKLDTERQQLKEQLAEYQGLKAALAEARYNPNKLLEVGGITQEEFTKLLLTQGGDMTPEMRVALEAKQRADASEKALQTMQDSLREREQERLVNDYRSEARGFIGGSEDHEFLRALGEDAATNLLMNEINGHYAENMDPATGEGPVLSYKEAADRLEARIERDMFDKYLHTKKMQAKFAEVSASQKATSRTPRTLTSNLTPALSSQPRTEREREAAAYKQLVAGWQ